MSSDKPSGFGSSLPPLTMTSTTGKGAEETNFSPPVTLPGSSSPPIVTRAASSSLAKSVKRKSTTSLDDDSDIQRKQAFNEKIMQVLRMNNGVSCSQQMDEMNTSMEDLSSIPDDVLKWVDQFLAMKDNLIQLDALAYLVGSCSLSQVRHLQTTIEPYFQKDFIRLLPKEIALHILAMMEPQDLARAAQVCRYWRTVTEDHQLWKEKCQEEGVRDLGAPRLALGGNRHSGPGFTTGRTCYARSQYKSMWLRHLQVQSNWRKNRNYSGGLHGALELRGHDEHVITCLQIVGDLIITGSDDNTLKIWSADHGSCLHTLVGHSGGVWTSQVSEDGAIVVSGSTDRTVRVWCTRTGQCVFELQGHTSTVRCMALKGDRLVSGSRDTTLRLWNIMSGECVRVFHGHLSSVRCVQFDGERIVSGAYDYTIKVWTAETGYLVHTLVGHSNRVYSLLFDSARDLVVSGSLDTSIRVWDIKAGAGVCTQHLTGHQSLTSGMQLKGNILVSGNADASVKVWNIADGHCLHTLGMRGGGHTSAVTSLQFVDDNLVATSSDDGTVKLWDVEQGIFIRDLVRLITGGQGGCIWRLKATPTMLACAVGSRNGTEDTKLMLLNFDADYP